MGVSLFLHVLLNFSMIVESPLVIQLSRKLVVPVSSLFLNSYFGLQIQVCLDSHPAQLLINEVLFGHEFEHSLLVRYLLLLFAHYFVSLNHFLIHSKYSLFLVPICDQLSLLVFLFVVK